LVATPRGGEGVAAADLLRALGRPALYFLIGRARLPRRRRERVAELPRAMARVAARLAGHPNVFHPDVGPALGQAVTLAENLGQSPILGGNAVELLADYDGTIARLVADIDRAEHHAHLLFYIFADYHADQQSDDGEGEDGEVGFGLHGRLPTN
jgi:hypothetical protein